VARAGPFEINPARRGIRAGFLGGMSGGDIIGDWGFTPTKKTYYIVRLYASKIKRHG